MSTPLRRLRFIRGGGLVVVGATIIVGGLLLAPDALGVSLALIMGSVALAFGVASLVAAGRTRRSARIASFGDLSTETQLRQLQRIIRIGWIALPAMCVFTTVNLSALERGTSSREQVFILSALLYDWFGFWPSVIGTVAFSVLLMVVLYLGRRRLLRRIAAG